MHLEFMEPLAGNPARLLEKCRSESLDYRPYGLICFVLGLARASCRH
jgi:hypothetical protein